MGGRIATRSLRATWFSFVRSLMSRGQFSMLDSPGETRTEQIPLGSVGTLLPGVGITLLALNFHPPQRRRRDCPSHNSSERHDRQDVRDHLDKLRCHYVVALQMNLHSLSGGEQ